MRRKITGFLLLLGLSLVLALWGCAAKPEEQAVSGSFVESEVPTPRLVYTARDGGKMRDLYYIPLSEELADMCREALDDPQKEKVEPLETVQLFQVELDKDQSFTVFETLSGRRWMIPKRKRSSLWRRYSCFRWSWTRTRASRCSRPCPGAAFSAPAR